MVDWRRLSTDRVGALALGQPREELFFGVGSNIRFHWNSEQRDALSTIPSESLLQHCISSLKIQLEKQQLQGLKEHQKALIMHIAEIGNTGAL